MISELDIPPHTPFLPLSLSLTALPQAAAGGPSAAELLGCYCLAALAHPSGGTQAAEVEFRNPDTGEDERLCDGFLRSYAAIQVCATP